MQACLLAVDSGGTKSDALLASLDGRVLGRGRCDVGDPHSGRGAGGSGRSERSVTEAVRRALATAPAGAGIHVIGRSALPADALAACRGTQLSASWVTEEAAALALAGERWGVVVLAGTGALCHASTPEGTSVTLDALGPLLGDHGSAFQIGLLAVRAVGQASWHERHATSLAGAVPRSLARFLSDEDGPFEMVPYMLMCRDRAEIASLARLVDEHAAAGDRVAMGILRTAAGDMAESVRDVTDRAGVGDRALAMVGTGSVAVGSDLYWSALCASVAGFAPNLRPVRLRRPAVLGVLLAGAAGVPGVDANLRERLLEQVPADAIRNEEGTT
jgi:N-acetylglucosamine kinase-like BadF-type ATPase